MFVEVCDEWIHGFLHVEFVLVLAEVAPLALLVLFMVVVALLRNLGGRLAWTAGTSLCPEHE